MKYTTSGIKFYVDPKTQQAQWSPPTVRHARVGGGETYSSSVHQYTAMVGDASGSGGGHAGVALPGGWEKRVTRGGRDYYVNHDQRCVFVVLVSYSTKIVLRYLISR